MNRFNPLLWLLFSGLFLFSACFSSGTTYSRSVSAEKERSNPYDDDSNPEDSWDLPSQAEEYTPPPGLRIRTIPPGAEIYINGSYRGLSNMFLDDLPWGSVDITARLEGYKEGYVYEIYDGDYIEVTIELERATGFLQIETSVPGIRVRLEGKTYTGLRPELPVGVHLISVEAFGFVSRKVTVNIMENATSYLAIELEEAPFEILKPAFSREIFNPSNPGFLGEVKVFFKVTAPGTGRGSISGPPGEVKAFSFSFTQEDQSFKWDGRDERKIPLKDGIYTVIIEGTGERDGRTSRREFTLQIDSTLILRYRSLWSGLGGFQFAATTDTLPLWGKELTGKTLFSQAVIEGENVVRTYPHLGFRMGLPGKAEITAAAGFIVSDSADLINFSTLGYKVLLFRTGPLSGAFTAKGAFHSNTGSDLFTSYTGLYLGFPLEIDAGSLEVVFHPEIVFSPYRVTYTSHYDDDTGFFSRFYLRGGIAYNPGAYGLSFSAALRTEELSSSGTGVNYPLEGGLEGFVMIPGSPLFISGMINFELDDFRNWYTMPGFGINVVY